MFIVLINNGGNVTEFLLKKMILTMSVISLGFWANAGTVTKMKIISAAQTVKINACSNAVSVQSQDSNNLSAAVPVKTQLFFTGSATSISFYSDSACAARGRDRARDPDDDRRSRGGSDGGRPVLRRAQ